MMIYKMYLDKEQSYSVESMRAEDIIKGDLYYHFNKVWLILTIAGLIAFFSTGSNLVIGVIILGFGAIYLASCFILDKKINRKAKAKVREGYYDLDEHEALEAFGHTVPFEKVEKKYIVSAALLFIGGCWICTGDDEFLVMLVLSACMIPIATYAFMYVYHRYKKVKDLFHSSGTQSPDNDDKQG